MLRIQAARIGQHPGDYWVTEGTPYRGPPLTRLTAPETALFDEVANDRIGQQVRLEQERIAYGWLQAALRRVASR